MKPLIAFATLLITTAATVPAHANLGDTSDPVAIMTAVRDRNTGDKMRARMTMVVTSSGKKRARTMQVRSIEWERGTKRLIFLEAPASMRNTGLLSVMYDSGTEKDDQWLYLPGLRRTTRISGSQKSGAFMGSDFSYSDMSRHRVEDFTYSLIKSSAKVNGEPCWLIEARPKTAEIRDETGYLKTHLWVSKDKLMVVQGKAWIAAGKKLKLMKFSKITKIDGVWVALNRAARTTRGGVIESTTLLTISDISFGNNSVSDADFSQRRLQQGI